MSSDVCVCVKADNSKQFVLVYLAVTVYKDGIWMWSYFVYTAHAM